MKDLAGFQDKYQRLLGPLPARLIVETQRGLALRPERTSERGYRPTPENQLRLYAREMWVDPEHRARVVELRYMDNVDGRVKKIHNRTANMVIKGGLRLKNPGDNPVLKRTWETFKRRLDLDRRAKLHSDARGFILEGNLPIQWVLNAERTIVDAVRMPSDTLRPVVKPNGRFEDVRRAYEQIGLLRGEVVAAYALWELSMGRLTPDNYDDLGSMGRPYLDASRGVWKKLNMTETDLVLRRRMRSPQRNVHELHGMSDEHYQIYRDEIEQQQAEGITTDYYIRGEGTVKALQGDANLDQIADVSHLLDTFFSGSPAPKGLFGYAGELSRDILEDMKRDFFEEVDALQDELAGVYQTGLELELLLSGANPENFDFCVEFAERSTETMNQRSDRALKLQALGLPTETVWEAAGLNASAEREKLARQRARNDPYPEPQNIGAAPSVTVTPGNQPKGESATAVTNP